MIDVGEITAHYEKNYKRLVNYFKRVAKTYENAEDIVQDAYEIALRYSSSDVEVKDFERWFSTVLKNCMRDFLKKEKGDSSVEFDEFEHEAKPFRTDLLRLEREIKAILETKNDANKDILYMFIFRDLSAKEIYMLTDYSSAQIRQAIYRFRSEMKELYERGK